MIAVRSASKRPGTPPLPIPRWSLQKEIRSCYTHNVIFISPYLMKATFVARIPTYCFAVYQNGKMKHQTTFPCHNEWIYSSLSSSSSSSPQSLYLGAGIEYTNKQRITTRSNHMSQRTKLQEAELRKRHAPEPNLNSNNKSMFCKIIPYYSMFGNSAIYAMRDST
jgi:hypothetical protein